MTRRLYRTPIPESALQRPQRGNDQSAQIQLAKQGFLDGGSSVLSVSGQPGEVAIRVQYRGRYAGILGLELSELLDASKLQELSFAPTSGQSELDGYYAIERSESGRIRPQEDDIVEVTGALVLEGTRASHRRAVHTNVSQPEPGNTFGNDTTALIGVPAAATRVQWIDGAPSSQTASPTTVRTETARFGDVDLLDARDPSFDTPVLVYDLPYDSQGDTDVGVWDTYGEAAPLDADDVVQWGRVYDSKHDPRGNDELVIENGIIRLWFDDADNELTAEEWNDGTGSWSDVSLGSSDWQLLETDVREIRGAAVEAMVTFNDSTDTDTEYALNMVLPRGYDAPQWFVPDGVTASVPTGLSDLLDPIADEQVYDAQPSFGLVSREDL